MTKPAFALAILLLLPSLLLAQSPAFNLDFEQLNPTNRQAQSWQTFGSPGYSVGIDSVVKHGGRYAFRIQSQPGSTSDTDQYNACGLVIPAQYAGKTIELSGFLKTQDVSNGYAGLWMRIDGETGALAFDNMNNRGVKGTTDWQAYTIKLELPEEAKSIHIGSLLVGNGTVWTDDLQVRIDGDDLSKAKPKQQLTARAQLDTVFQQGSGIRISSLNPQQTENLVVLGKVWGFLKYHHPAIAAGDYNWDFELFRILPKVLSTRSVADRSAVLVNWIQQFGPLKPCRKCDSTVYQKAFLKPDWRWLDDKKLISPALSQQLHAVYQNRNQGPHYYIKMAPGIGNPVIQHEADYKHLTSPDAGFRLLSLYRFWNLIEYFFPYKHLIGEKWDGVLMEFVPKFVTAGDALHYRLTTLALIGRIHDTHANLWGFDPTLEKWRGNYLSPVQVKFVENQAVVTNFHDEAPGTASGLQRGDVITKIDGVPVADLVKNRLPLTPASNRPTQLRDIARNLLRGSQPTARLEGLRGNQPLTVELKRYKATEMNMRYELDYASYPQDTSFRMLGDSIGLLYLAKIRNNHLPAIEKALQGAKGLVIDLRCYPSDFVVFTVGKLLYSQPTDFVKFTFCDVKNPGVFTFGEPIKVGTQSKKTFKGNVVILINEITQSNAEYTTMAFRAAPGVTVVGSQTAAADGNTSPFMLPGGLRTMFSGIGVYYPDGRETQRIGIVPDQEVKPTIQGIREGRDELLEKAVQMLKNPENRP